MSRYVPWLMARAPECLRDPTAELALALAYVLNPEWLRAWRLEPRAFTCHEARCITEAVLDLMEQGEAVTLLDATARVDVPPTVLLADAVLDVAPDVPALVRHLRDLYGRRRLYLLGVATVQRAADPTSDLAHAAVRLRWALDKTLGDRLPDDELCQDQARPMLGTAATAGERNERHEADSSGRRQDRPDTPHALHAALLASGGAADA
jgi:hypothetical protein